MTESGSDRSTRPGGAKRVRVVERVRTRFARFGEFVTQYSTNISMTGMFLRSDDPQPPGARFEFEFVVSDEAPMIKGMGEVVWVRTKTESEERPAGMGVRFMELDPRSRRVIRWLMEKAVQDGHEPFELGGGGAGPGGPTTAAEASPDAERRAAARTAVPVDAEHALSASSLRNQQARKSRRFRADLVILALIAVAVVVWWLLARMEKTVTVLRSEPPAAAAEPVPEAEATASVEESLPEALSEELRIDELRAAVRAWAKDWTDRDVERYLAHYSTDFETPEGMTRGQWEADRSRRLTDQEYIRVALSGFEVEELGEDAATVSFVQSYRSNRLDETVRKRLVLTREGGAWKIVEELRLERVSG